ncbi:MAG: chitobiase/beta-hexosaminidase C-terminal domain-containing protein [Myxococcaceae bacterium]
MRIVSLAVLALLAFSCGPTPEPLVFTPNATVPPPVTTVDPKPGPFNGKVTLTFTTDRPATVYVSTDGSDPRTTSVGRQQGESPFQITLDATTTVNYFASQKGKDEDLHTDMWIRAGGPKGTISGVVVVGDFAAGKTIGVYRNNELQKLGKPQTPQEVPFLFTGVATGTHNLVAYADRNGDDQLFPFIDYASATVPIQIDLTDPFKASAENVHIYLGTSAPELGTLEGTITLPKPPLGQSLRMSALNAGAFTTGATDPMALLNQLQAGYQIFTDPGTMQYPYVITDLMPGQYMPVPVLFGFGQGGIALNFVANPLMPANVTAGNTTVYDVAFGPVTMSGTAVVKAASAPQGFAYGVVAARASSFSDGIQAVLMPVIFGAPDAMTGDLSGQFGAEALRANHTFAMRIFVNNNAPGGTGNPLTDALTWVVNPFATQPAHATVQTGTTDVTTTVTMP